MSRSQRAPALGAGTALGVSTALAMMVALYLALIYAPTDSVQGVAQRIFYVHVPAAWVGFFAFFVVFVASILYLWKRSLFWDQIARSSAEIGLVFTTLMLITGSLWGRPVWGTWWTWDARLTTSLLLWFIYLGYFMLRSYAGEQGRAARYSAVLGIIGFLDVPITYQSVNWWRTLHPQPVAARIEGPAMPGEMVLALVVGVAAFTLLYATLMYQKYVIERAKDRLSEHHFAVVEHESEGASY